MFKTLDHHIIPVFCRCQVELGFMGWGGRKEKKDLVQPYLLSDMVGNPDMGHVKRIECTSEKPGFH